MSSSWLILHILLHWIWKMGSFSNIFSLINNQVLRHQPKHSPTWSIARQRICAYILMVYRWGQMLCSFVFIFKSELLTHKYFYTQPALLKYTCRLTRLYSNIHVDWPTQIICIAFLGHVLEFLFWVTINESWCLIIDQEECIWNLITHLCCFYSSH